MWFSIKRQHALLLIADNLYYNKFKLYCKPGKDGNKNCYADEHYLPTLLNMADPTGIANWSVTHVDWFEGKWHPKSYRAGDVTFELLKNISVCACFVLIFLLLFFVSFRSQITPNKGSKNLIHAISNRLSALSFHIREDYWVDIKKINEIYRYKIEEYSYDAANKFNIYHEQIHAWLVNWIPDKGGYLIGNVQPAHMDFRFFLLGNLWAIASSLTTLWQAEGILNLIEDKWEDLVGNMPLKICYPALEFDE